MSYDGYFAIAGVYDKLNKEIDYSKWADFFEKCFERYSEAKPEIVLDLACGTGRMTREMAKRGYDMIGVDGSVDMLSKAYSAGGEGILYLCQDMRELELYGTVGATVCCLDSLNYLIEDGELDAFVEKKYESFGSELGQKIRAGKTTLAELADRAAQMGTCPTPDSGRQEYLESVVNRVMFG